MNEENNAIDSANPANSYPDSQTKQSEVVEPSVSQPVAPNAAAYAPVAPNTAAPVSAPVAPSTYTTSPTTYGTTPAYRQPAANAYGYKPYTTQQQPQQTPAYSTYRSNNNTPYASYPQTTATPAIPSTSTSPTTSPAVSQYSGGSTATAYPYTPIGQQNNAPEKKAKGSVKVGLVVICIILSLVSGMIGSMIGIGQNSDQTVIEMPFNGNPWADVTEYLLESTVWVYADDAVFTAWTGSGVVISSDGYILTNHHVVDGARNLEVVFYSGDIYSAELIETDAKNDLALIKIDATGLNAVRIGNVEAVRVGDEVLGIGNQLSEFPDTVIDGIISHLPVSIPYSGYEPLCFQTNLAIMPGNSGGGMFNHQGDLIGINNASYYQLIELPDGRAVSPEISYAITIDLAIKMVRGALGDDFISDDASLDIKLGTISDKSEARNRGYSDVGVYISEIGEYGPAYLAGLKVNDRIVKIGNNVISSESNFNSAISNHRVGDYINVTVERNGQQYVYAIQLSRELAG